MLLGMAIFTAVTLPAPAGLVDLLESRVARDTSDGGGGHRNFNLSDPLTLAVRASNLQAEDPLPVLIQNSQYHPLLIGDTGPCLDLDADVGNMTSEEFIEASPRGCEFHPVGGHARANGRVSVSRAATLWAREFESVCRGRRWTTGRSLFG